jgi:hypothetical protein
MEEYIASVVRVRSKPSKKPAGRLLPASYWFLTWLTHHTEDGCNMSSETLVDFYWITQCYDPEGRILHFQAVSCEVA